jgi:hypothetical protein
MRAPLKGVALLVLLIASSSTATVVEVPEVAFASLGTIEQNTNWDDYPFGEWSYPNGSICCPAPQIAIGDLAFKGSQGGIVVGGTDTYWGFLRNVIADNLGGWITIEISGSPDLFAVRAANFQEAGPSISKRRPTSEPIRSSQTSRWAVMALSSSPFLPRMGSTSHPFDSRGFLMTTTTDRTIWE